MASPGSVVIQFKAVADQARRDVLNFATSLGRVDDEAKDADRSLSNLDTALDQVGAAADAAKADVSGLDAELAGADFDRVAFEAEQAARRLRAAASDMAAGVRTGRADIEVETDGIRANMADTGKEAGAEFIGNIAEGIGSGQANLNDVVSGTLGGITNLAATIAGPFGLAAAGVAAGVGLVFAAVKGEAEATKARIDELTSALEEVGRTSGKTARAVVWDTWLAKMQENRGLLDDIVYQLQVAGVKGTTFRDAITGSAGAQGEVRERVRETAHELLVAQGNGKKLTDEQQRYLDNYGLILKELDTMNGDLRTTQDYFDDVSYLSGKAGENMGEWDGQLDKAKSSAKQVNKELDDAAKPRTVKIHWDVDNLPRHLGGRVDINSAEASGLSINMLTPTATATPAPPPAPTVIVTEEQIARAIMRVLLKSQARNGRLVMTG